jgi:flagellar motor switch protein FliM
VNEIQYQVYDFASSARVERPLWSALNNWMEKFSQLFVERWSNFCLTPIRSNPSTIDAAEFESLQSTWAQPSCGVEVSFQQEATTGMLVISRVELLMLLMEILGDSADEIRDRELTPVELSLSELIFEQTAATMSESWPDQESLSFQLGELTNQPNRSRMFPLDKMLLVAGLNLQLTNRVARLQVVLAKEETTKLLGLAKPAPSEPNRSLLLSKDKLAEIEVQVTAGLGNAELAMTDLVSLTIGDIIVLDQCVNDPIVLFANDEPLFRGWPGRSNDKQALKIVTT